MANPFDTPTANPFNTPTAFPAPNFNMGGVQTGISNTTKTSTPQTTTQEGTFQTAKDFLVGGDNTTGGVIRNTIQGLPNAAGQVATQVGQGIARTVGAVGITAANKAFELGKLPKPFEDEIPTTGNSFSNALFGGQPIQTVPKQIATMQSKLSPYIGDLGSKFAAAPLVIGSMALDLSGFGGKAGVKSFTGGEIPEAFFKFIAKESDPEVINSTLKSIGVDEANAKALSMELAPTKSVNEAKDVLANFGKKPVTDFAQFKPTEQKYLSAFADHVNQGGEVAPRAMVTASKVLKDNGIVPPTTAKAIAQLITTAKDSSEQKSLFASMDANMQKSQLGVLPKPSLGDLAGKKLSVEKGAFSDIPITDRAGNPVPRTPVAKAPTRAQAMTQKVAEHNAKVDEIKAKGESFLPEGAAESSSEPAPKEVVPSQAPDHVQENFSNLLTRMELSQAGSRIMNEATGEMKGVSSTFPEWVSPELRSKALFDKVLAKLEKPEDLMTFKGSPKEMQLVNEIRNELKGQTGQSFKQLKVRQMSRSKEIPSLEATAKSSPESEAMLPSERVPQSRDDILKEASSPKSELESETLMQESLARQAEETKVIDDSRSLPKIVVDTSTNVKAKVGALDYMRTPDRVLAKIGLNRASKLLRAGYDNYLAELPQQLSTVRQWAKEMPGKSNEKIFDYLDGKNVSLTRPELKVANEVKQYLREWADRLNLPKDNTISNYITHIFEKGAVKKEFDEDLAKIIDKKVAGSVYNPFLEKRTGAQGYIKDTWKALDAYVKRAVRKANMDGALKVLKEDSHNLELSQLNYVKKFADRVNMRPTEWDNLLDNTIKQLVGYRFGQRPTAALTSMARKMVSRGMLGLNLNSAIKNLTQGVNTFAKLGTKYTTIGYIKLLSPANMKELKDVGVLSEDIIQDKTLSAVKNVLQTVDKGLYVLFETAEKINRGSAYFGAKTKALDEGMNEYNAVQAAKQTVRDTQFVYGSIDTPVGMNSDIAKTMFQFMTYPVKQTEMLADMVKNKEWMGLVRYIGASIFISLTLGKVFSVKLSDFNPLNAFARFGQPPSLALPIATGKALMNTPDQYGKVPTAKAKLKSIANTAWGYVPAGLQLKKLFSPSAKKKSAPKVNPFSN